MLYVHEFGMSLTNVDVDVFCGI